MSNICLIGCVKTKRRARCMAKDMYISTLFKERYKYAQKMGKKIYIISAKYGLIAPNDKIEPYDMTLKGISSANRKKWAARVVAKLESIEHIGRGGGVMILAGKEYREWLERFYRVDYPFIGLGFGLQIKKMKEKTR